MAEPAADDEPAVALPAENRMFEPPAETRAKGLILPRSLAADRVRKSKNKKKGKKKSES
jgi:hypothetical protein